LGEHKYVVPGSSPFAHGVAGGDPLTDRATIWTHVYSERGRIGL
jgi:phosphodiesterase/alkaline phosphatase D-like protein